MNTFEKDCIILWDEMRIKERITFNKSKDKLVGIVDHGKNARELASAKEALVVMVKGLNTNWAFPISFYFSSGSTKSSALNSIILENITSVEKLGLKVRVGMCDMGLTNQGVFRIHDISETKPFIETENGILYLIHDPVHLIKLVRNHLKKHGFQYEGGCANWSHLEQFYDLDSTSENRLAPKLTRAHFDLTDISKMKVKLATQILSHSVYAGLRTMIDLNKMPAEAIGTANFVKYCNDLFDLLNISVPHDPLNTLKSGNFIFQNRGRIIQYKEWIKSWKCLDGSRLPDCIRGFILTLEGLSRLIGDLEHEGYRYVLTRKLQQDSLEHYFGYQRARVSNGDNPTAEQFTQNFKTLFLIRLMKNIEGSNCEFQGSNDLLQIQYEKLHSFLVKNTPLPCRSSEFSDECEESYENEGRFDEIIDTDNDFFELEKMSLLDIKDENVAVYIGNWAIKTVLKKKGCESCEKMLEFPGGKDHVVKFDQNEILTRYKSRTGDQAFESTTNALSYGHTINKDTRNIVDHIIQYFRIAVRETLQLSGTHVTHKIQKRLLFDDVISSWIKCTGPNCEAHKMKMLNLIVTAKIYQLVKTRNQQIKCIKSTNSTLNQLRHQ